MLREETLQSATKGVAPEHSQVAGSPEWYERQTLTGLSVQLTMAVKFNTQLMKTINSVN